MMLRWMIQSGGQWQDVRRRTPQVRYQSRRQVRRVHDTVLQESPVLEYVRQIVIDASRIRMVTLFREFTSHTKGASWIGFPSPNFTPTSVDVPEAKANTEKKNGVHLTLRTP